MLRVFVCIYVQKPSRERERERKNCCILIVYAYLEDYIMAGKRESMGERCNQKWAVAGWLYQTKSKMRNWA